MKNNNLFLSFCIPVYNEERLIKKNLPIAINKLNSLIGKNNYEIIIINNGSTDNTANLLNSIQIHNIKAFFIKEKAHGSAMRKAIKCAKGKYVLLTAIDLPFGFSDLEGMLKMIKYDYSLVLGSKKHSKSKIYVYKSRKLASLIYQTILKLLFKLNIGDTQGTLMIRRKDALSILKYCDSKNAFFTAQLVIYSRKNNLKIIEVPVIMTNNKKRKSNYNIFRDGTLMLFSAIKTYINYHSI